MKLSSIVCKFVINKKLFFDLMGMTGFDSKVNKIISMSSIVILSRKKSIQNFKWRV